MKRVKKLFRGCLVFILGVLFATCVTVLANTIDNIATNKTETIDVEAAASDYINTIGNLDGRITNVATNGVLPHIEFITASGATHGGFIDFHYGGNNSVDHTSRIIETASGKINFEATNGVKFNGTDIKQVFKTKKYTNSTSTTISSGSAVDRTFNIAVSGYTSVGLVDCGGSGTTGTAFIDKYISGDVAHLWISNPSSSSKTISSAYVVIFYIKSEFVTKD